MARVQLDVRGMTCTACERRIARSLRKVAGVHDVEVSARRGRVSLRTRGAVPATLLHDAIRAAGYDVGREHRPWLSRDLRVWRDVAIAAAVLAWVVVALQATGLTSFADRAGTMASSGSLAVILLVGVAAGFSTCMALVGGMVLAVSARFAEEHRDLTTRQRLRPQVAFNVGRVVGFAVLGALLGAVGSVFALDGMLLAVMLVAVSVVMGLVGLRLTQVSPRISAATMLTLPAAFGGRLDDGADGGRYSDVRTALLGAATFVLPCGFTQAVQVYALSTGSPWQASAIMALFAVGTLPGLLGIGTLTAVVRGGAATGFFRFAGVAVIAMAAVNVSGAAQLLGPSLSPAAAAQTAADPDPGAGITSNVTVGDGAQVLRTTQVAQGYEPADARVLAGVPVQWEIDSQALTCAASLYSPDLGIDYVALTPGLNTFELTLDEPGTYVYTCGMGMYTGTITAVAAP